MEGFALLILFCMVAGVIIWAYRREDAPPMLVDAPHEPHKIELESGEVAVMNRFSRPKLLEFERTFKEFESRLKRLWKQAEEERRHHQDNRRFPDWYYEDVTPAQERRLVEMRVEITEGHLTKGMASDIIGLMEPPEEFEYDHLTEAGISPPNDTIARYVNVEWSRRQEGKKPAYGTLFQGFLPAK